MMHIINGDPQNGWYCYECNFFSKDVAEAAAHDGSKPGATVCKHMREPLFCADCHKSPITNELHILTIQSLHDGQAKCSCGGWHFSQTGQTTKSHIEHEFRLHSKM